MSNSASRRRAAAQRHKQIQSKTRSLVAADAGPQFVADVMLGRLAKWLRIAGFDVLYSNRITDEELVALSRNEGRIILSKDTRLLVRKSVQHFIYLESDDVRAQIRQVFSVLGITGLPDLLTRCLDCNHVLEDAPRDRVRDRVPPFVFATQPGFKRCPHCDKIYWAGTHRQAVLRTLQSLFPNPAAVSPTML